MTSEHQLYLGLASIAGLGLVVFFLKDRITSLSGRHGKTRLDLKAKEPESPRPGIRAHAVEAGRDATIANRAGDGVDAEKVQAKRDAAITNDPPPKP